MDKSNRKEEEMHFYRLFTKVLESLKNDYRIPDVDVGQGIQSLCKSFLYHRGNSFRDFDLTSLANIYAYIFRFGAIYAGLTRCRILDAVQNCELLEICLRKQETPLRVVSLGGGSGADIVGFCSVLQELGFPEHRRLDIRVMDAVEQWKKCIIRVKNLMKIGRIREEFPPEEFGNVSELFRTHKVTIGFVQTKLPTKREIDLNIFRNADVILMQKLLSSLNLKEIDQVMKILVSKKSFNKMKMERENIHSATKDEALVLVIDAPPIRRNQQGRVLLNNAIEIVGFQLLYQSEANTYSLLQHHFGPSNHVATNAQIAILRKMPP